MSFLVVYVWRGYKKSVYQKTIVETRYSITEVKQPVAARPKGGGRRPLGGHIAVIALESVA